TFILFSPITLTPIPTLFPYTTLFRSDTSADNQRHRRHQHQAVVQVAQVINSLRDNLEAEQCTCTQQFTEECHDNQDFGITQSVRSEEHTSELQSRFDLVCRLLLEKKK